MADLPINRHFACMKKCQERIWGCPDHCERLTTPTPPVAETPTFALMGKYACGFTNDGRHCLGCGGSMQLCGTPLSKCPYGDPNEREKVTELLVAIAIRDAELTEIKENWLHHRSKIASPELVAERARADAATEEVKQYFCRAMNCKFGSYECDQLQELRVYYQERAETAEARAAELERKLEPVISWLDHIEATGSRRLADNENPEISGWPKLGQLRAIRAALRRPA